MNVILDDVLQKLSKTLERGYDKFTVEYHYINNDSYTYDVLNSHNDFAVFFGRNAIIPREDRFRKALKEMLDETNFKLDYVDFSYDNKGNIVNVLLSAQMKGE